MKKPRSLLLFLLVFSGLFLAVSQAPQEKNAPTPPGGPKVKNLMILLQKAKSLEELDKAHTDAVFTQSETDSLMAQIKASPNLQAKLSSLTEKAKVEGQAKLEQAKKEMLEQEAAMKQDENMLSIQAAKGNTAVVMAESSPSGQDCNASTPTVSKISSPVRPGVALSISGKGFGDKKGTVTLFTNGKSFSTVVMSWTGCLITAQVPDNITGVKGDNLATVSLTTANGKMAKGNTKFVPIMDVKMREKFGACVGGLFGSGSCDNTYWDSHLQNDWQLTHHKLWVEKINGHAEITDSSMQKVPNGSTRVKVHSGCNFFGYVNYYVSQYAKGPRGLNPW